MIRVDRLLLLASYLAALNPKRFEFANFVGWDWKGAPDLSCQTTACGLGHATSMPEFQALGFHLARDFDGGYAMPVLGSDTPTWKNVLRATNEIFGLDETMTEKLFIPAEDVRGGRGWNDRINEGYLSGSATAKDLAAHIRRFCEEHS